MKWSGSCATGWVRVLAVAALGLAGWLALSAVARPITQPPTWWTLAAWPLALLGAAGLEEG